MTLKRPINKLFPLEFSNQKNIELNFVNEKDIPQVVVEGVCVCVCVCEWGKGGGQCCVIKNIHVI